jgi:hypothetical protein
MKINSKANLKSFFDKHGTNNHVMMSVIISHTPDIIKNMIILFMKTKAEIYKNVFFLIYFVDECDISNIANNFPTKKSEYPYIIYIYDNSSKLLDVSSVTTLKTLRESFCVVEPDYEDTLNNNQPSLLTPSSKNSSNQSDNNVSKDDSLVKQPEKLYINNQFDEQLEESKKLADKILMFMKYKTDYDAVFIKDIQRRKKIEKKINNQEENLHKEKKKNNNSSNKKK